MIQRLDEAGIDHAKGKTFPLQKLGGFFRCLDHRSDRDDRRRLACADRLPGADRNRRHEGIHLDSRSVHPRIADRDRAFVVIDGRFHHVAKLVLILGHHQHHVRNMAQVGDIVHAVMRLAVRTDKARPVDGENDIRVLPANIMDDLVVGALQEGGVHGIHRLHPFHGHRRRHRRRMLLRNADVDHPAGEARRELHQPGSCRHRRSDRHDALVALGQLDERIAEHLGIHRRSDRLEHLAGFDLVRRSPVPFERIVLGRRIAFALDGNDMHENRSLHVARLLQHIQQLAHVVAVDRTEIMESELLEQDAAHQQIFDAVLEPLRRLRQLAADRGDFLEKGLQLFLRLLVMPVRADPAEILMHRSDIRGDRHLVVIQDDDQVFLFVADMVHRFERHAAGKGAVADDRDDLVAAALQIPRQRHAHCGREGGAAVACLPYVMLAFAALDEAAQPALLAQAVEAVHAAGQDLVDVRLVSDVEQELVFRTVEQIVERKSQFDDAKVGGQMPAGRRQLADKEFADFGRELIQLRQGQLLEILRSVEVVEQHDKVPRFPERVSIAAPSIHIIHHYIIQNDTNPARSAVPLQQVVRHFQQPCRLRQPGAAKSLLGVACQLLHQAAAFIHADQERIRDLACGRVAVCFLTHFLLVADQVENIVLDLEREPDVSTEQAQMLQSLFAGAPEARSGENGKYDQIAGFVLMDIFKLLKRRYPLLALHIGRLPANHSCCAGEPRQIGGYVQQYARIRSLASGLCRQIESMREEGVAGQNRHGFAVDPMVGRLAAPKVVVVHGRKIVMDERIRMDKLYRACYGQRSLLVARISAGRLRGSQHEHGTNPLASGREGVSHGFAKRARHIP
ncbi:hypothetical protein BN871_DS_00300 [Paenibacillus sp. P22]|nr:hypothetical protein BN871_DS_00300 [Paenibacillus sp. P22]